jgi:hypothetical protein
MRLRTSLLVGSVVAVIAAPAAPLVGPLVGIAYAACSANDAINGTTASDAARRIESAGYSRVQDLTKGCDNAWHGTALANGTRVRVVWTSEGLVLTEGD